MSYTTIADQYYRDVPPNVLLDGARGGIVAYLRSRGIMNPHVSVLHARPDGRGVVPAIERQLAMAIVRYGSRIDTGELVYAAIRGELAALHDPYTVFFTKSEVLGFTKALDGVPFGGVGIVLVNGADQHERVDAVFAGSPAARAGITVGDRVVSVDGTLVDGLASNAISALLRGPTGTTVQLVILRADETAGRKVAIVRAAITPPDVRDELLPGGVGYLALRTFGPRAGPQIHAAIASLRARGARALIFDLRGNGGGYESSAVAVASAFVPSGTIVITQANHGHKRATVADGTALEPLPLAVLVDRDSASASELVTGAILDHRLGTVVGARTFGKGLVQSMVPLPDGSAIKVTTARYFTPNGRDIDRVGITPNVAVDEPADAVLGVPDRDPQLQAALGVLSPTPEPAATATYR